jgi:hypothetical protein
MVRRQASLLRHSRPRLEALEVRNLLSTWVVDRLTDDSSGDGLGGSGQVGDLRFCLTGATDGDTITFAANVTGTINLTAALPDVSHNLNIQGPGAALLAVRRASGGNYSVFRVTASNSFFFGTPSVTISGLTIANGLADKGGGIYNNGNLVLNGDVIVANAANSGGGVFNTINTNGFFFNNSSLTITGCTISGNVATNGGGVYNDANANNNFFFNTTALAISGSVISGNKAVNGGGVFNNGGNSSNFFNTTAMTIDGTNIIGNQVSNDNQVTGGGGVWNNGTLVITNSSIVSNSGTALAVTGAGVVNTPIGTLTIANSTIANNIALVTNATGWAFGGGIYNEGVLNLANDTVALNQAHGGALGFGIGGGILNEEGLFNDAFGTAHVFDTLVASNTADAFGSDLFGMFLSAGHNLISNSFGGTGFGASDLQNVSAGLDPKGLQSNGGPTLTIALLPISVAISNGDNTNAPATDQRGFKRKSQSGGTIDIGAYEFNAVPPSIHSGLGASGNSQAASVLNQGSSTVAASPDSSSSAAQDQPVTSADSGASSLVQAASDQSSVSMLQKARNIIFALFDDSLVTLTW